MFGNIKPLRQELKLRDYSNYRSYYCGLCKSMGARYAGLCNMGLSYEAVFIAIMISAIKDDTVTVKRQRCFMHPFTKQPMVVNNDSVDTAATVNVLLMYNSLCDNIRDENDFKSKVARIWFKKPYKKARKDMPAMDSVIYEKLDDLSLVEAGLCDVLDKAAEPFAELMGETASRLISADNENVYWFGFFMGKWVYVIDAFADIEEDIKNKSYNPFVRMYHDMDCEQVAKKAKDDAEFVLAGAMAQLEKYYGALEIKRNRAIIENILFEGMPARTKSVLSGQKRKKKNKDEYEMQE